MNAAAPPSPLRILLSRHALANLRGPLADVLGDRAHRLLIAEEQAPGIDFDLAFVSRDVPLASLEATLTASLAEQS